MRDQGERLNSADLDTYLRNGSWSAQGASSGPGVGAPNVGFSVSLVAIASGARRLNEQTVALSVTLLLQPVQGSDGALASLPGTLAGWAAHGVELLVDASDPQTATPKATFTTRLQIGNLRGTDQQVESLWQRLMAPAPGPGPGLSWWTLLADQLPRAATPGAAPSAAPAAEPPIVRVPRGNAAVSIALRRAKNVRERTAEILNPKARAEAGIWRTASLDRGDEHMMIAPPYQVAATTDEAAAAVRDERTPAWVAQDALSRTRRSIAPALRAERDRAKELAERERQYASGPKDDQQLKSLLSRKKSPAAQSPAKICEAVEGADAVFCNAQNAEQRALHFAATDHGKNVADERGRGFNNELGKALQEGSTRPEEAVQRRLQVLESLPRLCRLLNLVVEAAVELDLTQLRDRDSVSFPAEMFVSIAARFVGSKGNVAAPIWTRAKLTVPSGTDQVPLFWPCTQEEIDAARVSDGCVDEHRTAISQRAGIVDLGAVDATEDGAVDPRFDLVTVDAVSGIEAEINQELANEETRRRRASGASDDPAPEPAFVTLRSAGLCLVDRWRQEAAIKTASRAAKLRQEQLGGLVLDADMLQVGWRLDVGVRPTWSNRTIWRSLCNRVIDLHDPARPFGDPGSPCGSWVEAKLAQRDLGLSESERLQKRVRLDGSYVTAPLRRGSHTLNRGAGSDQEVLLHADDLVAQWEGDPLGIECSRQITFARPGEDLAIMQVHKPVARDAGLSLLPPPLRFGQRYRFGARAVYRGGVVQPLGQAAELYRTMLGGTAVLPADSATVEGRTFRRHERIGPVVVTQTRKRIEEGRSSPYWLPQGLLAVLRQAEVEAPTGGAPVVAPELNRDSERRILVPPNVGLTFATLHGVFDGLAEDQFVRRDGQTRPRDGLGDVAFSTRPLGGFPMLAKSGDVVADIGEFDRASGALRLKQELRGDAVFDIAEGGGGDALQRPLPYYPDPAARFMVIRAVRTLGGPAFEGPLTVVPLYDEGAEYPDARPVVLDIARRTSPLSEASIDKRRQRDLVNFDEVAGIGFLDGDELFWRADRWPLGKTGPRVPVRRVQAWLQPGDDITFEVWCIPDRERLAHWFDVVESAALLLSSGNASTARNAHVCLQKLSEQVGCMLTPPVGSSEGEDTTACGAGGLRLPSKAVMEQWADLLHQALRRAPVPEIASVQQIQAIHATSRPRLAPVLVPQAFDPTRRVTYVRRRATDPASRRAFVTAHAALGRWREGRDGGGSWSAMDEDGATDVMFGGTVNADLDTGDLVSLVGTFASPDTDRLDDERRGFSPGQLERYERGEIDLARDSSIFGFFVGADGRVSFPEQPVTLMTLRDLAPARERAEHRALEEVDMLADLKPAGEKSRQPKVWRYTFKDNLARRLSLSLASEGRFGSHFKTTTAALIREAEAWRVATQATMAARAAGAARPPTQTAGGGDPWSQPTSRLIRTRSSLERLSVDQAGARTVIWINATRRPARIEPKSLLPAFTWSQEVGRAERRTMVRLRFKRPWFSSGQEERLGVVVWPPNLFSLSAGEIAREKIPQTGRAGRADPVAFSDADLGPGGSFVTRWGSDPIRKGAVPDGWLVPREVFADHGTDGIRFVQDVLMPLPADDRASPETPRTVSLVGDPARTMRVSLITYEPRFDPVQALWYVDLALNPLDLPEPFMRLGLVRYQEHAAEHLRVSEPVVEWVQLLPARSVSLSYARLRAGERGVPIEVKVRGHGSLRAGLEADPHPDPARQAVLDRPIMRAEISRRRRIGSGPHFEEGPVIGADDAPVTAVDASAKRSADGLTWTLRLLIPADEDPRKAAPEQASYRVFVEEVMQMLPAGGSPGVPSDNIETGPRFSVSLDL